MTDKEAAPPRGRPRGFCVDAAVETALQLFQARGYDGVGVAELAAAIGIAAPSLYAAFGSKAGLYARALDLYEEREGGWLRAGLAADGGPDAIVHRLITGAAAAFAHQPGGCLVCRGDSDCTDPAAAALITARRSATRAAIRDRLTQAGAAGSEQLADYVLAALHGLTGAARDGADAATLASIARGFARGPFPSLGQNSP